MTLRASHQALYQHRPLSQLRSSSLAQTAKLLRCACRRGSGAAASAVMVTDVVRAEQPRVTIHYPQLHTAELNTVVVE